MSLDTLTYGELRTIVNAITLWRTSYDELAGYAEGRGDSLARDLHLAERRATFKVEQKIVERMVQLDERGEGRGVEHV